MKPWWPRSASPRRERGNPDPRGTAAGHEVVVASGSRRDSATGCSSRTSTSRFRAAASSASSVPTAPARPRCSA
jgi:hypothetical protein